MGDGAMSMMRCKYPCRNTPSLSVKRGQGDLFAFQKPVDKTTKLMTAMDAVNATFGRGSVRLASQGFNARWKARAIRPGGRISR